MRDSLFPLRAPLAAVLLVGGGVAFAGTPPIVVTEWMYDGSTATGGEFVEFTNISKLPIDLTGWSFSDDARAPGDFPLTGIGIVQPGESFLVAQDPAEQFRLVWGLGPQVKVLGDLGNPVGRNLGRNDEINLYDQMGNLVDRLTYGDQSFPGSIRTRYFSGSPTTPDAVGKNDPLLWSLASIGDSYGSWTSTAGDTGNPGVFSNPGGGPPPGPVTMSLPAGFYTQATVLTLEAGPDDTIRYTLDGSIPTVDSPLYEGSVAIADRTALPNLVSTIPTAMPSLWASPIGQVFKITTVRARAFNDNGGGGPVSTRSYIVHPDGAERFTMPVVSLVFEQDDFFGYDRGIYVPGRIYDENFDPDLNNCTQPANYTQSGDAWERPGHIEFFEPDGEVGFALDVGFRIHGGCTRSFRRKSIRVYARSEYGQSWINHAVFPGDEVVEFKRLILRNGGNDWMRTLFRDAFMQDLVKGQGVELQNSRPAIVFLNGEYWGIHNIRDRQDKYYLQTRMGADPDNIDLLETNAAVEEGDDVHFLETYDFIRFKDMADAQNFEWVENRVDIDNMVAYYAIQLFFSNSDWPQNNIAYWRPRTPEGKWRWMLYDLDQAFGVNSVPSTNSIARIRSLTVTDATIFNRLLSNPGYRDRFLNRSADLMNSAFLPERVLDRLQDFRDAYAPEIPEHFLRWRFPTLATWLQTHTGTVMVEFATNRPGFHRQHLAASFGLSGTATLTVAQPTPELGAVVVNTVELPANEAPWQGVYFNGVAVPIRGIASDGARFLGFAELPQTPDANGVVWWTPSGDATLTALFAVCPGDTNGDNLVNFTDLNTVLGQFGQAGPGLAGDVNDDGVVNFTDLNIIVSNFGANCAE